jgi:hypothetical protein
MAAYRSVGDDADRAAALDANLARLADSYLDDGAMEWEYLLVTAIRR